MKFKQKLKNLLKRILPLTARKQREAEANLIREISSVKNEILSLQGELSSLRSLLSEANGRKTTICLEGDDSIMMNLQELQTVVTNKLPVKIILINNAGYHSIRQTQNNLFSEHCKVGIGPESGDLSFPEFKNIASAFGLPYFEAHSNAEVATSFECMMRKDGCAMLEIFVSTDQIFEPKNSVRRLDDGTFVSAPLEYLAPFLPRDEFANPERNKAEKDS